MNGPPSSATPEHCSSHPIHIRFLVGLLLLGLNLLLTAAAHAQISYRSATTASTTSASSLSINKPLGTVANDVLIASIAVRPNTISISAPGSSSITQVGIGATVGEDGGSVTAELPTGIAIGDLMICLVESHDNVSHSTSTSGWAKMYELSGGNNHTASLFWKVATSSSETNPVISHSNGSSIVTRCIAYRGVNTTTPFDTTPVYAADSSGNNATSVSTGTLTTMTNGVKLLFAAHIANNPSNLSVTTGGGLTWSQAFLGTHNQSGDNDAAVGLLDADQATAGSAGAYTASYDQPGRSHGVLLALRPASSSGGNNWTLIRSDTASNGNMGTLATYYKIAGTSEPSSYTFTFSAATTGAVGSILAFSGVDTTSPIDQQNGQRTPNSVDHTAPSVTTTSSGDMLVTAHAYASSRSWTPPPGMTEQVDIASTTGAGGIALEVNTEPQATAAVTGPRTATAAGDRDTGAAHFLALRPIISLVLVAQYHFDELSWNGTPNEVTDSSVNVYSGTAASLAATKPTTADAYPANPNNPGTCRYGSFNRTNKDYVALPASFPNLGANGNAFTITAWIKTTNNTQPGQRIFIDDENNTGGFGISLGDGSTGRVRFYSRGTPSQLILDTANVITN
ncbi:MAG: LamG-like jellyroll fold domain-containing protein, partial [Desulfurivibrionaceae bacterium]